MELRSNIPDGPLEAKWEKRRFDVKLVNPANKRKYKVIMVGTGLAGASGAASLAELGYEVAAFCYQDSPRRAHSIAAQGGINAAKNYRNDGDSVHRLFYDTIKGGDFRAREANVHRLAEISVSIIDQCVAQGVPFGAYANAGAPEAGMGWASPVPPGAPEAYAEAATRWAAVGALVIGGCCGTGPAHTAALARRFRGRLV